VNDLHNLLARASGGPSDAIIGDARPGELAESRLDVTKARQILGFEALTSLEEGIKSVIHWMRG